MRMLMFEPRNVEGEKYAVTVPVEGGGMAIIQSYHSLEQLETGYKAWKKVANEGKLTKPYPVELFYEDGKKKCRVLTDRF